MNKPIKITFILLIAIMTAQITTAANLYVNSSQSGCSDATITRAANTATNSWCGANATFFQQCQSGDIIYFANGTYDYFNGLTLSAKDFLPSKCTLKPAPNNNVTFTADANLSATSWINEANISAGSCSPNGQACWIWNTTSLSTSDSSVEVEDINGTIPMINMIGEGNVTQNNYPVFSCFWSTTGTDRLRCRFPTWYNPRNQRLAIFKGDIFTVTNVDGFVIDGSGGQINFRSGERHIYLSGTGNDFNEIKNVQFYGGATDTGVLRVGGGDGNYIANNNFYRHDQTLLGTWWYLRKYGVNTELSWIYLEYTRETMVYNNTGYGGFNGLVVAAYNLTYPNVAWNVSFIGNNFTHNNDDAFEIEGNVANFTMYNNTCTYSFVCFSGATVNFTGGKRANISRNYFEANLSINYSSYSSTTNGADRKFYTGSDPTAVMIRNADFYRNHLIGQEGIGCNGYYNFAENVSFIAEFNIPSVKALQCTGRSQYNVTHGHGYYFRYDGGDLAGYVNSTSSTGYTSIAALQAVVPSWFNTAKGGIISYLLPGYRPSDYSIVCNAGPNNETIGYWDCRASGVISLNSTPTETTADIRWSLNGSAPYYDIYKDGIFVATLTNSTLNYTFTGLTENTTYAVKVITNHSGYTGNYQIVTFTTDATTSTTTTSGSGGGGSSNTNKKVTTLKQNDCMPLFGWVNVESINFDSDQNTCHMKSQNGKLTHISGIALGAFIFVIWLIFFRKK